MKLRSSLLLSALLVAVASFCSASDGGTPWPMPQKYETFSGIKVVDASDFAFKAKKFSCDILDGAFERYLKIISDEDRGHLKFFGFNSQKLKELEVTLENPCERYPSLESDESYKLNIGERKSTLSAKSVWGALRGLETFSQLIHKANGRLVVNQTNIEDFPRFAWRGILLDTSRHFLPVDTLLRSLDAMAYNKINVFHWHIVDTQSFPYESYTFPKLSLKGAYHPQTHVYSQSDVAKIIEYARMRGIRVVVEFDSPGHMGSWENGQPGLLTECYKGDKPDNTYGPLDPSKESAFKFIKEFFTEVSGVFPDRYIHLGGDEVDFNCWRSNERIRKFMEKIGIPNDYQKLESYYVEKLLKIVEKLNKSYIVWQEVFDDHDKVDPSTVVQVWKGGHDKELDAVTSKGLRAILSSPWYLDYVNYGALWQKYYKADPHAFTENPEQQALVMGGEACLWGEFVDSTNLHSRLWPSASAIAERLWSPRHVTSVKKATVRLDEHRCRMLRRGIMAGPPSGPGFCDIEASL